MTDTLPGADERRIRHQLRKLGVGPDAIDPPVLSKPAVPPKRKRDWLDDILDGSPTTPEKPQKRRAPTVPEEPAETDETDPDDQDDEEGESKPPRWDPLAITDRIIHSYRERPAGERLRDVAQVVVASRARFGQLLYTATGVWAAWRIGFTPWLLHHTATAPVGIPVVILGAGWLVNRRLDGAPLVLAWCGRAAYTATVINLVLHP